MTSPENLAGLTATSEYRRLADSAARRADWKKWGPYLSERAWGTVREDYSPHGNAWIYFPHDHARSRAYRWNEDGLGGFCNRFQNVCLALALWNEQDPILKERLFGLSGEEGNHGEDVKEIYYYLDGLPSHAYMRMLYKYPQVAFPYADLVAENRRRDRQAPEYELDDALQSAFASGQYFDVYIEYAKASQEDLLCRVEVINHGAETAPVHMLPHIWFRNTWSWGYAVVRPELARSGPGRILMREKHLGERYWTAGLLGEDGQVYDPLSLYFTENETNYARLFGIDNPGPYVKDSINEAVIRGDTALVNPAGRGTKAAAHFRAELAPGGSFTVGVRFCPQDLANPFDDFAQVFANRRREADEYYAARQPTGLDPEARSIQRQALAGLLWSKQFYHYSVELWLDGDPGQPPPPPERQEGRNADWRHLYNLDVLSMPDKWEYPWYAAWDLAFHMLPVALVDTEWAKRQLVLLLREWYMHPNGQIPAYEWAFSDVNPPVHAWAALQVYRLEQQYYGRADTAFLERIFHKLLLNFTWWVNRKDHDDNNIFQGGFLGLDNIGVFDRSKPLPTGGYLDQADGTAWMAMYSLNLLAMALELALTRPVYEDVATKFFEHFIYIVDAFYRQGFHGYSLWDAEDGFFYDVLHTPNGQYFPLKLRSFVGLIPLFAVEILTQEHLARLPRFKRRMQWFLDYRSHLVAHVAPLTKIGREDNILLAVVGGDKLGRILAHVFDRDEFLSPFGVRSLSRYHAEHPYIFEADGGRHVVRYEPAESSSEFFGGNSNWRGPVWFPLNYLLIDALRRYHQHLGESFTVEMPTGSGQSVTLVQAADELCRRLVRIFLRDRQAGNARPVYGGSSLYQSIPGWGEHLLFYEYFHGDTGAGLGASHQTGWTALVANLIQDTGQLR